MTEKFIGRWARAGRFSVSPLAPNFGGNWTAGFSLRPPRAPSNLSFTHSSGSALLHIFAHAPFPQVPTLQDVFGSITLFDGVVVEASPNGVAPPLPPRLDATLKGVYAADKGVILLAGGLTPGGVTIDNHFRRDSEQKPTIDNQFRRDSEQNSSHPPSTPGPSPDPAAPPAPPPLQTRGGCDVLVSLRLRPSGYDMSEDGEVARRVAVTDTHAAVDAVRRDAAQKQAARALRFFRKHRNNNLEGPGEGPDEGGGGGGDSPFFFDGDFLARHEHDLDLNQPSGGVVHAASNGWISKTTRERILPTFLVVAIGLLEK